MAVICFQPIFPKIQPIFPINNEPRPKSLSRPCCSTQLDGKRRPGSRGTGSQGLLKARAAVENMGYRLLFSPQVEMKKST